MHRPTFDDSDVKCSYNKIQVQPSLGTNDSFLSSTTMRIGQNSSKSHVLPDFKLRTILYNKISPKNHVCICLLISSLYLFLIFLFLEKNTWFLYAIFGTDAVSARMAKAFIWRIRCSSSDNARSWHRQRAPSAYSDTWRPRICGYPNGAPRRSQKVPALPALTDWLSSFPDLLPSCNDVVALVSWFLAIVSWLRVRYYFSSAFS